ncbi:MAG: ImmA/IrrE family metallo-endopeptidase [Methanomicrobiales archaeon]|nr:ImmA/IrrE family metallo-endopeptidase [Methanomicrobiales archaeon]
MRRTSLKVNVNPSVMRWLRESSGWSLEDVSNHLHVPTDQILQWEQGGRLPTLSEVERLARAYRRPLAAFFLAEPEEERPMPRDFRRLSVGAHALTKKTLLAIRKARNLQAISADLMDNLDLTTEADVAGARLTDDPEEVAEEERRRIGIAVHEQQSWKSAYEGFRAWRDAIEEKNIRVFQFPMTLEELRGCVLMDSTPYAILLNSSDIIQARMFTLLHEYGHILLHEPALCTPDNPVIGETHEARVENWCNRFAGAILMPPGDITEDFIRYGIDDVGRIANRYRVSLSTTLTRLVTLKLITQEQYQAEMRKLKVSRTEPTNQGGGGESSAVKAQRERGEEFVSLVLENARRGYITHNEALDYLGIKVKHLRELTKPTP